MTTLGNNVGKIPVTISVPSTTRTTLTALKPYFAKERERVRAHELANTRGLTGREARARRDLWEEEKARLRRAGELADSIEALVTGGVVQEIETRGWNKDWPTQPRQSRGRWPGSPNPAGPAAISVRLPVDLVLTVRAGCWAACGKEVGLLSDWRDRYPDARPNRPHRPGCDTDALAEYHRLAARIITPGEVWRAALVHGLSRIEQQVVR
ncbi:hypothetical protein ACIOC1_34075 [Streptomyces sp. NPDC088197]|uniref:hypothetical protein n=1 Tax=unclassified Streptomyces TaxID=2593676 RepID=UPI0036EB4C72